MHIAHHEEITQARPQSIWGFYEKLDTWHIWDHEIEFAQLEGPFTKGSLGKLKPQRGPMVKFRLVEVTPYERFQDISFLPLTKLIFTHELREFEGKTKVIHRIEMKGLLSPLFALILGKKMRHGLPRAMKQLVALAEISERADAR